MSFRQLATTWSEISPIPENVEKIMQQKTELELRAKQLAWERAKIDPLFDSEIQPLFAAYVAEVKRNGENRTMITVAKETFHRFIFDNAFQSCRK
jgi:hypothetical protein